MIAGRGKFTGRCFNALQTFKNLHYALKYAKVVSLISIKEENME